MIALSVVIPTCNRPEQLAECLKRVAPEYQGYLEGAYEVVVTDDGRRQPAEALVESEFPWARWVEGPARGHAANRNNGAAEAKGEWLVYTDDDCLPDADWLTTLLSTIEGLLEDAKVILQGATLQTEDPPSLLWEAPHDPAAEGRITANFAIRRSDYLALEGIDERYLFAFEDIEFFSRAIASGASFQSVPDAVVRHPLRLKPSSYKLAQRWQSRVVYALDQGMSPMSILWRLPLHVAKVIPTRFLGADRSGANVKAAFLFVLEWLQVLAMTPAWIARFSRRPRSPFWSRHVDQNGPAPNYGM